MKKNVMAIILAICLAMCACTACGKKEQPAQGGTQKEVVKEEKAAQEQEETEEAAPKKRTGIMAFNAKDLEGNEVSLGDIIEGNKVTLINVWGTFCEPCKDEMPDLNALYEKYKDQGFGIVGLTNDVLDDSDVPMEEYVQDGKDIIARLGVTYPVLMETQEMKKTFDSFVVPNSYFVDSEGNMLGKSIAGSQSAENWESLIKEKLGQVK